MTEKKLEELQEDHSQMLATAVDLGIELPEELKADFTDAGAGATICSNLDALIRAHQTGRETAKPLAEDDDKSDTDVSSKPKSASKKKPKAAAKAATTEKPRPSGTAKKAAPKDSGSQQQEKPVAKTAAKKATAKKAAKKKATGNARKAVAAFDEKAKITKTGKDNPAREGSGKFDRIANVLAHNGKTVGTYLTKGKVGTLRWCVNKGLVKVA